MSNTPANQQPPAAGLTAEQITAIVKAAVPQAQPQQRQQQAPPTEAEIAKMLNRFEPDDNLINLLFGDTASPETRKQALNSIIRGAVTEAITVSRYQTEHMGELLYGSFEEPLADAREYGQEKLFTSMYKDAPGLKSFDPLVRQLSDTFSKDPNFPKTKSERATFLREKITAALKTSIPDFDPTKEAVQKEQPQGQQQQQSQGFFGEGNAGAPGASQQPARVPAGGSGGMGGGTGAPAGGQAAGGGANPAGGPTAEKPWGF